MGGERSVWATFRDLLVIEVIYIHMRYQISRLVKQEFTNRLPSLYSLRQESGLLSLCYPADRAPRESELM